MNHRNNWFDKALDRLESPTKVGYYIVLGVYCIGAVRTVLYGYGMNLTNSWFDAPFRWCIKLVMS